MVGYNANHRQALLQKLAEKLDQSSLSHRNLKLFRQSYFTYSQIGHTVSAQLQLPKKQINEKSQAVSDFSLMLPTEKLLNNFSFSHFLEL